MLSFFLVLLPNQIDRMKRAILSMAIVLMLIATSCNRENAEKAVNGYLSETINEFKEQLPEELKLIDSILLDSAKLQEKIAETTNVDSLAKYRDQLLEAKNMLQEDLSKIDSLNPEIRELLELNQ